MTTPTILTVAPRRASSRLVACSLSATTLLSMSPACDPAAADAHLADGPEGEPSATDAATPARRTGTAPLGDVDDLAFDPDGAIPPLPDPALFGVDPDPRHWDLPSFAEVVPATHAADVDPAIVELDTEVVLRPSERRDRYVELTIEVTARDADGNPRARVVYDTHAMRLEGDASHALIEAIVLDLMVEVPRCDDITASPGSDAPAGDVDLTAQADAQAGGGGGMWPGGAAWWGRVLCQTQRAQHLAALAATQLAMALTRHKLGVTAAACTVAACADAASHSAYIIAMQVQPALDAAASLGTLGYVVADNLRNIAAGAGLGGVAGPNAWPVVQVGNALVQMSVGRGALTMAQRAITGLTAAMVRLEPYPQLTPSWLLMAELTAPMVLHYRDALLQLVRCYDRLARWAAAAGMIGFVALVALNAADEGRDPADTLTTGASGPGGAGVAGASANLGLTAPPDVQADGPVDLAGFMVVSDPLTPRANQYAAAAPLVYDISALPSYQAAATLIDHQGRTTRAIRFGYAEPHATITEDIWGIDEITGLPTLLVAAGSPIDLTWHQDDDGAPELAGLGDRATVGAVLFDLVGVELDPMGNEIGLHFACVSLDNTCPLSVGTTGSPEQIAAHERVTRHWRILSTSSIVDVETGASLELPAGHVVTITAPLERPADSCYDSFDAVEWKWVWNHLRPDCISEGEAGGGPGGPGLP
jgi:hypothetical protein